jgi:hypothetical protein
MTMTQDKSGLGLRFGTYEQARAMIGARSATVVSQYPVSLFAIQYYCAAMQDPNAAYWDQKTAEVCFGGFTAPPGMLQSWTVPLPWHPESTPGLNTISILVPLPGDRPINVSNEIEYFQPLRIGDMVSYFDQLVDVSEEKTTRVGIGHFITTIGEYRNQNDQLIAKSTNILFRYQAHNA